MASAVEQLAANVNFGAFAKAKELQKRILFTLGALIIYRVGTYIPIPGVDASVLEQIFDQTGGGGMLGMLDMFAGGALGRMTIFALNIMPYISAAIIMQLMATAVKRLEELKKEGESGRRKLNQYTRYLTVVLATVQGFGLAVGLEQISGLTGPAVAEPGLYFRVTTVITIVGGVMFLMWLGEQITARGIGNGISLIIFAGIVAELPRAVISTLELGRTGALSGLFIIALLAMALVIIFFIVYVERAQRRILVQYPRRQVGNRMFGGESSHLPLKLNTAGVIPAIFASSLLLMPVTIVGFSGTQGGGFLGDVAQLLSHGQPLYMLLFAALIVFFCFFYTAIVFNPEETAENLRKYGGFIPGIRPGQKTAEYLDFVLTRLTVVGSIYMVIVCLIPEFLIAEFSIPFYLGGTSLLIVVTVTMDTVGQIHSHLMQHQYEGLIKKAKLKGRRG